MTIIYLLVPLAVLLAITAVVAFVWAVRRGQFDDLETPGMRILHDEERAVPEDPSGERRPRGPREAASD